jgi:hypothetical protein
MYEVDKEEMVEYPLNDARQLESDSSEVGGNGRSTAERRRSRFTVKPVSKEVTTKMLVDLQSNQLDLFLE